MTPRLPHAFLTVPLAHRALHDVYDGRPENSRAAIRAAIANGYGIEIDLQLSSDGVAMVFHDDDLDRLTEATGLVRDQTAAELARTPLRGGSEGIPTFTEVLSLVAGQVPLLVEIKDQDGDMGPAIGPLEEAAARAVAGYDGPLALMSFNPHSVARLSALCPDRPCGLVTSAYVHADWPELTATTCDRLRDIPDFDRTGASFISHEVADLGRPRVAELKARGIDVLCWTVRSEAQERQARKVAQNITFERYLAVHPA
jgi:glycerophosphoryl diester phosphodiesterase